jgi:Spy/CpxP family protein refolding chaperone
MLRRLSLAIALSAALAVVASAQPGRGFPGAIDNSEGIARELKLSDAQKAEVNAILDQAQKQTLPLVAKIREGRTAFIDSTMGDKPVDATLQNITDVYAQVIGIEADAMAKVMAKLDDKQKQKAAKVFTMSGLFLSGDWRKAR